MEAEQKFHTELCVMHMVRPNLNGFRTRCGVGDEGFEQTVIHITAIPGNTVQFVDDIVDFFLAAVESSLIARPFTVTGGEPHAGAKTSETILVPMMTNAAELPYSDNRHLNCRVVGLPYKGREVTMYLVLPRDTGLDAFRYWAGRFQVRWGLLHVVGLPYKKREGTMYLVLPRDTGLDAFRALEKRLSVDDIEELISTTEERPVIVSVPRMRLESTLNLKDALEALGVHALFDPSESDLRGISPGYARNDTFSLSMRIFEDQNTTTPKTTANVTKVGFLNTTTTGSTPQASKNRTKRYTSASYRPAEVMMTMEERPAIETLVNPGLYADDVIHKVEIEVTETGTIASAATAVTVLRDGSRHVVRFDRPFLFFIRHEPTKLVLFWGSVVRPVGKGT
uniref:Serpin domain-containing protein n=1 Tax=Timema bartmani TaxID=61472 RepID=A0A7R9I1Z9_9NEOP|nr:unnamed protein product [Timema bartmani]